MRRKGYLGVLLGEGEEGDGAIPLALEVLEWVEISWEAHGFALEGKAAVLRHVDPAVPTEEAVVVGNQIRMLAIVGNVFH